MTQNESFRGKLKLFRLKSEVSGFFMPITGKEVEQHLTIRNDGRVWLNRYGFSYPVNPRYERRKSEYYKISKERIDLIFELITEFFKKEYQPLLAEDAGYWDAVLINSEGEEFYFIGNLFGDYIVNGIDLCKLIRDELNLLDLLLFDGNAVGEYITKAEIDFSFNDSIEKLILDHKEGSLIINKGEDISISVKNTELIRSYLESHEFNEWLFIGPYREDLSIRPEGYKNRYSMVITSSRGNITKQEGYYDAFALPYDWSDFISFIESLLSKSLLSFNFISSNNYERKFPKEGEIIYCSISFNDSYKTYYYISDFDDIQEGDRVIVPVGDNNREEIGVVKKLEFYIPANAPFPVEKTKHIIKIDTKAINQ